MLYENPFDKARRQARARGECPVMLLDEFFTNHWTFDELCADFNCKSCVASLEDLGLVSKLEFPDSPMENWQIPF